MDAHEDVIRIKRSKPLWVAVLLVLASPWALRELKPAQAKTVCAVVSALFGIVALVAGYGITHFADMKEEADAEEARIQRAEDQRRQAEANAQNTATLAALTVKLEAFAKVQTELVRLPTLPVRGATQRLSEKELTASGFTQKEFDEFSQHLSRGHDVFLKGQLEFVSKRYQEAVLLFDEAAVNAEKQPSDPELAAFQQRRAGVALASSGLAYKALGNADQAIRRFRDALGHIDENTQKPVRAEVQGMLAVVLLEQAQRSKGDQRIIVGSRLSASNPEAVRESFIHEAIALATEAQKVIGSAGSLKDIAWVANTLGTGYSQLADVREAAETEGYLQRALSEFRRALDVINKESFPELWAIVKGNKGTVLQRLAESRAPDEARSLLSDSIVETRAAGEELLPQDSPELWARNQQQLATAYRDLASLDDDPNQNRLNAITCYRHALLVLTPDGDQRRWAVAQQDLSVLLYLYASTNPMLAEKLLLEAQTANDLAATIFTRSRDPKAWANGRINGANIKLAMMPFVQATTARALMTEVAKDNEEALQVFTKLDDPLEWGRAKVVVASDLILQAQSQRSIEKLSTALALLTEAQSALTEELAPTEFARLCLSRGSALYTMAALKPGEVRVLLTQSVSAYQSGMDCLGRKDVPGSDSLLRLLKLGRDESQSRLGRPQ